MFFNDLLNYHRITLRLILILFILLSSQNVYANEPEWVFVEKKDGIELFESKERFDGLIPFKAKAILKIPHETIVKVLVNMDKKSHWAPKLKKTKLHQRLSSNQFVYSEYYSVPAPFNDREFFLLGTVKFEEKSTLFIAEAPKTAHKPAFNHVIANVKKLELKITPCGKDKTEVEFTFLGDMGGWVPKFVINIIQKRWPVKFIQALSEYISKNKNFESELYDGLSKNI